METIIVPTDFSKSASKALEFAVMIAQKSYVKVNVSHIIDLPMPGGVNYNAYHAVEEKAKSDSQAQMNDIHKKYEEFLYEKDGKKVIIETDIIINTDLDSISQIARQENAFLILMGTHSASVMEKVLGGTTTTDVLNEASCPVMIVPEETKINHFKKMVYATDLKNDDEAFFDLLLSFANYFSSEIECVHVGNDIEKWNEERVIMDSMQDSYKDIYFRTIGHHSVVEGLNDYLDQNPTDLLVLLRHNRNFWESLFHNSITKKIALNAKVPLLIFKARKND
jgi:nucleotide-binding universal stress UspA family protein